MHVYFGKLQFIANRGICFLQIHALTFISDLLIDKGFVSLGTLGVFHSLIRD